MGRGLFFCMGQEGKIQKLNLNLKFMDIIKTDEASNFYQL
jgi:hypothetical protein